VSIFTKNLDLVSKEDLDLLVTTSERERVSLEYKKEINSSDEGKRNLIKHVAGMANAEGGLIIFGIEEDNKSGIPRTLCGMNESVGSQKADEWIDAVVSQHTSPRIAIRMRPVPISPEKIAIVLLVPLSGRRPHMSNYDSVIYRRYNTQTRPASEFEIREMYQRSGRMGDERKDFLRQRNLLDTTADSFCQNANSLELATPTGKSPNDSPMVALSSCPRFLEERVDIAADDIRAWLKDNPSVKVEHKTTHVFPTSDFQTSSDSVTCSYIRYAGGTPHEVLEYVEIHRYGFVEQGLCRRLIRSVTGPELFLNLGGTTVAFWAFLKFLRNFYQKIDYLDEFSVYLSIRNADQLGLHGFMGRDEQQTPLVASHEDSSIYHRMPMVSYFQPVHPKKPRYRNFQHQRSLTVSGLDDQKISDVVKEFSTRIANNFGLQKAHCYDADGSFATAHLDYPMESY